MLNILFSPIGTIDRDAFVKGAVVLLAVNFFSWLSWLSNFLIGSLIGFLSFGLIYCWFCVFAKRLRGVGLSPVLFLPIFIGFLFIVLITMNLLSSLFISPEIIAKAEEFQALQQVENPDIDANFAMGSELMRATLVPYAVAFFTAGCITAFGFNRWLDKNK